MQKNIAKRAALYAEKCADWRLPECQRKDLSPKAQRKQVVLKVQQELIRFAQDQYDDIGATLEDERHKHHRAKTEAERYRDTLESYADPDNWDGDRFKGNGPRLARLALGLEKGDEEDEDASAE